MRRGFLSQRCSANLLLVALGSVQSFDMAIQTRFVARSLVSVDQAMRDGAINYRYCSLVSSAGTFIISRFSRCDHGLDRCS